MLIGHSNFFFNSLRPNNFNEGVNGSMTLWATESFQGIIRLVIHCVAFGFFTVSGFTTDHYLKNKKNWWLIKNGLVFFLLDFFILSIGWQFPKILFNFNFFPIFEALGAVGLSLCFGSFLRKLSSPFLIFSMVFLYLSGFLVNQFFGQTISESILLNFFFLPTQTKQYLTLYPLTSWLSIYILGMLVSRSLANAKLIKPVDFIKNNLLVSSTIVLFCFLALRLFITQSFDLAVLFQLRLYPPSLSYILLSTSWLGFVISLYQFLRQFKSISILLNYCGQHARAVYSIHPFIFGTINYFLLLKPGYGTFIHAFGFWLLSVLGLYFYTNRRAKKST